MGVFRDGVLVLGELGGMENFGEICLLTGWQIWNSLRDERNTLAAGVEAKRKAEEDMM